MPGPQKRKTAKALPLVEVGSPRTRGQLGSTSMATILRVRKASENRILAALEKTLLNRKVSRKDVAQLLKAQHNLFLMQTRLDSLPVGERNTIIEKITLAKKELARSIREKIGE